MESNIIVKFDRENSKNVCIDGFKIKVINPYSTLNETKLLRLKLVENGYLIDSFKLINADTIEIEGWIEDGMTIIQSIEGLVTETKIEEKRLTKILYNSKVYNFEVTLYVSTLE